MDIGYPNRIGAALKAAAKSIIGAALKVEAKSIAYAAKVRSYAVRFTRHELFTGPGCAADIGWLSNVKPAFIDKSARFMALYKGCRTGAAAARPKNIDGLTVLLIKGLFGGRYPTYMNDNEEGLKDWGFQAVRSKIDTDGTVAENAKVLAGELAGRPPRSVVVFAHSKGGLDLAAALVLFPEVKASMRAAVFVQSPFAGSPIASDLEGTPEIRRSANALLREMSTTANGAVADLSYKSRQVFMAEHPLREVDFPIICLGSESHALLAVTALVEDYVDLRYGRKSDGLVCPVDAILPGTSGVVLPGLDHASSVLVGIPDIASRFRPRYLTQAAVALALEQ